MIAALRNLGHELRTDINAGKAIPACSAGLVTGLGLLVAQIAFGSFIFSGPLEPYSSQGIGLILFGNFAACLIIGLAGGFRGSIAGLSPALVAVMAAIAASVQVADEALFATVSCVLIVSALATGLGCFLIGRFGLANLVGFVPYPVSSGFVAGLGATVCLAAMSLMGADPAPDNLDVIMDPDVLLVWLPGFLYGAVLYFAVARWGNPLILPASFLLAIGGYNLVLDQAGLSVAEAAARGLLLASTADGGLWPPILPSDLTSVDWLAVAALTPDILILMLVALVCVVMNISGLELAVDQELDWNHEFRTGGIASMVAGLCGGTVATLIVPASLRAKLLGATTRLTGMIAAAVIAAGLVFGSGMIAVIPTSLIGGFLVFAGLGLLAQGFRGTRSGMPSSELAIIILIFIAIILIGVVEGVAIGMLATLVLFSLRLSRVDPVEARFTLRELHSSRTRPVPDQAILLEEGQHAHGYRLRGYIFFGSATPLIDLLRNTLAEPNRPACLMLDFSSVTGLDFSAASALARFIRSTGRSGVPVVLSAVPEQLMWSLKPILSKNQAAELVVEDDFDRGLEQSEDIALTAWKARTGDGEEGRSALLDQTADGLERHLERQIRFEQLIEDLGGWLSCHEHAPGEDLAGGRSPDAGLQLLVSGLASARDQGGVRLRQFGQGDAILSIGQPGAPVASVVADEACRTMILSPTARHVLEKDRKDLAIRLYGYLLDGQLGGDKG